MNCEDNWIVSFRTSIKEQGPDDAKVESAEPVASDVVQEVGVLAEALLQLRVREIAQLLEELAIEAGRRRGARAARAPRARARTALRRDAPEPRPSAPPASHNRPLLHTIALNILHSSPCVSYVQFVRRINKTCKS